MNDGRSGSNDEIAPEGADDVLSRAAVSPIRSLRAPRRLGDSIGARIRAEPQRRSIGSAVTRLAAVLAAIAVLGAVAFAVSVRPTDRGSPVDTTGLATPGDSADETRAPAPSSPGSPQASSVPATGAVAGEVPSGPALATRSVALLTEARQGAGVETAVPAGKTVFVLDGAVIEQGARWRLVQFSGDIDGWRGVGWHGWVEEGALAEAVQPEEPTCPDDVTVSSLAELSPGERLTCYGGRSLTLTPVITGEYRVGASSDLWLSDDGLYDFLTSIPYHTSASGPAVPIYEWLAITGHFDDPGASRCGSNASDAPDIAALLCRERFTVTDFSPADPPDSQARGTWRRIADAPIRGREAAEAAWTGTEMLVWGGWGRSDGAAYDPAADTWRILSPSPLEARESPASVWTGREFIVWGGDDEEGRGLADGAAYDPASDRWRRVAEAPLSGRAAAAWTGAVMVLMTRDLEVATYDPMRDAWEPLPAAPVRRGVGQLVWTGDRILAIGYGGFDGTATLATLDLQGRRWSVIEETRLSAQDGLGVWTGQELISMTSYDYVGDELHDWAFDPATGEVRRFDGCRTTLSGAVWTGQEIVSGEIAFDPTDPMCRRLPRAPDRTGGGLREAPTTVWTGTEVIFWSGGTGGDGQAPLPDGVAFHPDRP